MMAEPELAALIRSLTDSRRVRAVAELGDHGTPLAWAGSLPRLLVFERGLAQATSSSQDGVQLERWPHEALEGWENWPALQAGAPLAALATARIGYDPSGLLARRQRAVLAVDPAGLASYRDAHLAQAEAALKSAESPSYRGVPAQLTPLLVARRVATAHLYPALLSWLPTWAAEEPARDPRLPHRWRALTSLRLPRSLSELEGLYGFGGESEARRLVLATRGLGMQAPERAARQALDAGYHDGAVRLLRDEAARLHAGDVGNWAHLSPARRERLGQLLGLERSPLGPAALDAGRRLISQIRAGT